MNKSEPPLDAASIAVKLSVVWAGTIFGIKLSDLVLLATLIYTLLQIGIVIYDRLVKPWIKVKSVKGE